MTRNTTCAASRAVRHRGGPQVVRTATQFGPAAKSDTPFKLFLDDARNPPLNEEGWVVVRTVDDAKDLCRRYVKHITGLSLDNDLGADPQGFQFLEWVLLTRRKYLPVLHTVIVHTGNMPKWRLMMAMLRETKTLKAIRRVPHDRIYPRMTKDKRYVKAYRA